MKQQDKPTYNGLTFDSVGEMHLYWWCEELLNENILLKVETQPMSFVLSEGVTKLYSKQMKKVEDKVLSHTILNSHSYTADFKLDWNENNLSAQIFQTELVSGKVYDDKSKFNKLFSEKIPGLCSLIEVKPSFDQNNMTRLAILNQKWVFAKFGAFINIVVPEKLFDKTFTPKRFLTCDKSNKPRKINYKNVVSLEEFLESKQA